MYLTCLNQGQYNVCHVNINIAKVLSNVNASVCMFHHCRCWVWVDHVCCSVNIGQLVGWLVGWLHNPPSGQSVVVGCHLYRTLHIVCRSSTTMHFPFHWILDAVTGFSHWLSLKFYPGQSHTAGLYFMIKNCMRCNFNHSTAGDTILTFSSILSTVYLHDQIYRQSIIRITKDIPQTISIHSKSAKIFWFCFSA